MTKRERGELKVLIKCWVCVRARAQVSVCVCVCVKGWSLSRHWLITQINEGSLNSLINSQPSTKRERDRQRKREHWLDDAWLHLLYASFTHLLKEIVVFDMLCLKTDVLINIYAAFRTATWGRQELNMHIKAPLKWSTWANRCFIGIGFDVSYSRCLFSLWRSSYLWQPSWCMPGFVRPCSPQSTGIFPRRPAEPSALVESWRWACIECCSA